MKSQFRSALAACALVLSPCLVYAAEAPVKVWEETITLPTYGTSKPDLSPMFYDGRTYQGAKGPIYPYPIIDTLTDKKENQPYKIVYLENKYVKIGVMPEIGGRIFSAVDKTNGYDFFYRQHVIKPALIGMLGAWISGGVEWNIPHHHRASSFMTVDYKTEEAADGSKTVWVGEMELRHRMRWLVGLTLHPERSYLEATVKMINRTPVVQSFLYFANVAVHTNDDYQIIFPPSTEVVTQHSKVEMARWPIADTIYGGADFTKGVDVSMWKNHARPLSMFAHESKEDFLAGYDFGKKAGTLHVGDHGIVTGKKFFTWGKGSSWDNMLTDTDGPYLELMVGAYSDNQPDYSWIQPYEVKTVKQFWYPFQQIGGVKNANLDVAVNLELKNGKILAGVASTAVFQHAAVTVSAAGKNLMSQTVVLEPGRPFVTELPAPSGIREQDLNITVRAGNKTLISYQGYVRQNAPLPPVVERPKEPKEVKSTEELYLTGLRLEQFHSPAMEPDPYYEEALRRDPTDYQANTALGILYYRKGRFADAEARLRMAVEKVTKNYTAPRDGEALYYLGLTLKAQRKFDEAHETLYRATWSYAYSTAGYTALAEIAGQRGDYQGAVAFLDRALKTNTEHTKGLLLKAALLRVLGRENESKQLAQAASAVDPIDRWAMRLGGVPYKLEVKDNLSQDVQSHLEIAVDLANAGLWNESAAALNDLIAAYPDRSRVYPEVYYLLGFVAERQGNSAKARENYRLASSMPSDYAFPFRLEMIEVLNSAIKANPSDARAPYYLGNMLYDLQPEAAIAAWEKARSLDSRLALVHRNLGWAYSRVRDNVKLGINSMEAAVKLQPEARFLYELDYMYEVANVAPEKRLALLEAHHKNVMDRDDTLDREIRLSVQLGKYDRAIELLKNRTFHVWEGGGRMLVHTSWADAHILRGHRSFQAGDYAKALADYQTAMRFPENLSAVEFSAGDKSVQVQYLIGLAQEALGRRNEAKAAFERALAQEVQGRRMRRFAALEAAETLFYQALALDKLGRRSEASELFSRLVKMGEDGLQGRGGEVDVFAKFGERQTPGMRQAQAHYAIGLGLLGAGKRAEAQAHFEKAVQLNVNHLGAATQLNAIAKPVSASLR